MTNPYILVRQAGDLLKALHDKNDPRIYRAIIDERGLPNDDPSCIWAKAHRRYLRRIATLPIPEGRPWWWTQADEANRSPAIEVGGWCCRTCVLWRSQDGRIGYCGMDETPATVNCGETNAWDLCEQWACYDAMEPEQMGLEL